MLLRFIAGAVVGQRGRVAEYWGPDYLDSDRVARTLRIPSLAAANLAAQSSEFASYLDAFVAGMNAYAARHPDRLAPEARAVLPVTPIDVLADALRALFIFLTSNGQSALQAKGEPPVVYRGLGIPGSNAWAIAPARTLDGHALLLVNPHLPWSDLYLFFEAHLAGPDIDAYGATLVGAPVLVMGFNDALGWAHTVNTHKEWDAYELTLSGDGYMFDGAERPFDVETETMTVRQPDGSTREEPLVIRRSIHGPVFIDAGGGPSRCGSRASPRRRSGDCSSSGGRRRERPPSRGSRRRSGGFSFRCSRWSTRIATATSCTSSRAGSRCSRAAIGALGRDSSPATVH